jgi:hypothetical protein
MLPEVHRDAVGRRGAWTPRDSRLLVKDLSLEVPRWQRLLILGPSGSGRTTLLRAAAGLWSAGQGRVVRPPAGDSLFLPQRPYLRAGTLRAQLLYGLRADGLSDDRILAALRAIGGESVLQREGGLDAERDWANTLSLGEQQLVAFARLLLAAPPFAFLDEAPLPWREGYSFCRRFPGVSTGVQTPSWHGARLSCCPLLLLSVICRVCRRVGHAATWQAGNAAHFSTVFQCLRGADSYQPSGAGPPGNFGSHGRTPLASDDRPSGAVPGGVWPNRATKPQTNATVLAHPDS